MIGGFVVLDALVLNTDRHHENWAMFRQTLPDGAVRHWLAPTFDHASSLGRELTRGTLLEWQRDPKRLPWYAKKGRGAVFLRPEGKKGANPLRLAELGYRWWPEYVRPWLRRLQEVGLEEVLNPVQRLPEDCISTEHRAFVSQLLEYTYSRLVNNR